MASRRSPVQLLVRGDLAPAPRATPSPRARVARPGYAVARPSAATASSGDRPAYYDHPEPFAWLRTKALLDSAIVVAIMAPLIRDCATEGRILDLALDAGAVFVTLYLIRAFYDEAYGREFDAYDRARDLALRWQAQAERLAIEYDDLDYDEDEEGYDDHDYESYRVAQPEPRRGWRWRPTKMAIEMVSDPDDEE